jgi:hypothetical protein
MQFKFNLSRIVHSRYFPIVLLILLPIVLFWKATFGQYVFAVGDLSGSDLLEMHLPFKQILHDAYSHFSFPLWTPYLSNGFPILAEGQSGPLYLPHIILSFLPAHIALNYSILLAFIVAGTGGFVYARTLPKMSVFGAFCVGLLFMFSSFFIARIKHLNMIIVASYFPWSLFFIRRFFLTSELKYFIYLGFIWSLQLFAGHPHMFYFCVVMCGWYVAGELGYIYFLRHSFRKGALLWFSLCSLVGLAISLIIGVGLAAAQLLPTYELTQLSTRQQFTYQVATDYPLRPQYLASLFAPFFLGNPASGTYKGDIHNDGIWWENVLYIGLLPFVISILLLIIYFWRSIKRLYFSSKKGVARDFDQSKFHYYLCYFFVTLIVFYLLSMGSYTPLFGILYNNLPGMDLFRFPNRFILFTLFCLCVFSGWGITKMIERLMRSRTHNLRKDNDADYTFSWPFSPNLTYALVSIVLLTDLAVFAYQYISFFPVKNYLAPPKSLKIFNKDTSLYRIYPTSQYAENPFGSIGWAKGEKAINSLQVALPGNFSAFYGLFSFTDRAWFEGGLGVKERFLLENIILKNELPPSILGQLMGLWNVKYFITFAEVGSSDFVEVAKYELDKAFGVPIFIYRNVHVMPRAYFVKELKKVPNEQRVVEGMLTASDSAYPRAYELDPSSKESSSSADVELADEFEKENTVTIRGYSNNRVEMITKNKNKGYLVFSDTYYPGWKAFVDGKETPIRRVNLIQRAIRVDSGEHKIIWAYTPFVFYSGLGISFATLITVACILTISKGRKGRVIRGKGPLLR